MRGKVYLIGAGPGDPDLLTIKGREALSRADVVVFDALLDTRLLEWARPDSVKIFAGKRGKWHAKEQSEINALIARKAKARQTVVRLKGGDPYLFGRGAEEAAYLTDRGIPFEIIPGVTSASGVAAYAGIPLTSRHLSRMVTLVTGNESHEKSAPPVEWSRISRASTLVIYMGLRRLPVIARQLQDEDWPSTLPAIAIQWGTTAKQVVVEGTLGTIAAKTKAAGLTSPVLVILGRVVGLRKKLRWFDTRPLFGKTIVVTRAAEQASEFSRLLADTGADVLSFPTIQIHPPKTWASVDQAISALGTYDWILFTSVNGVAPFFERLRNQGGDIRDLKGVRLGAIGPKTAQRLKALGLKVDLFPEEFRAEALADALGNVQGQRVLLARAEVARDVLPKTLTARGARVDVAVVYRTTKPTQVSPEIKHRLLKGEIDVVTFTSSSTVDGFMGHFSASQRRKLFTRTQAAVIGPITEATLKRYGVNARIRAKAYTIDALSDAIVKQLSR